jgi:hypothetical protein
MPMLRMRWRTSVFFIGFPLPLEEGRGEGLAVDATNFH